MAVTLKELKDDALIDIKVNKAYYFMLKSALLYLFENSSLSDKDRESSLKNISELKYYELTDWEKTFQTLTRVIGEIERVAKEQDLFTTTSHPEPGEEGYVPPTQD